MDKATLEALTFEAAYELLQETVQQLESDTLPLAEMLALYEKGIALSQHCDHHLEQAELSIKQLNEAH